MNPAIYVALVVGLSVAAQWLGWRLRLPSLLFLLVVGFALGRAVSPDEVFGRDLLFAGVNLCVAIILFEGALSLKLRPVRDLGRPILRLCTVTVAASWLLVAVTARLLGFDLRVALLLGAILVVTGPTVINPILRQLRPTRRVSGLLRWEGIIVDPLGAILALLVYQGVTSIEGASLWHELGRLGLTVLVALLVAVPVGLGLTTMLRRHLIPDFLQGVVFVGVALATVVGSNLILEESGLLAVTALGVLVTNRPGVELDRVLEFKENLQVLLVGALFVMLAGRVTPTEIADVAPIGLAFVAILVLIVRPVSVQLGLAGTETSRQERFLMSFMAPRGIVAASITSVFALQFSEAAQNVRSQAASAMARDPQRGRALSAFADRLAGMSGQVDRMVPLVFLVIVCTVAIYGLGIGRLAERLGLASASPRGVMFAGSPAWAIDAAVALRDLGVATMFVTRRGYDLDAVRAAGLRCEAADFLSEYAVDEMDLSGIASMVAVTPDDNVNSIGSVHYRRALGRANVFGLRRSDEGEDGDATTGTVPALKALTAFDPPLEHSELDRRWRAGARVGRVRITDQMNWQQFRRSFPDAVAMFVVRGSSTVVATPSMTAPKAGEVVVYLGDRAQTPSSRH
ncbi:cation:proton antiporter [Acidipropionibacterium virtanenii]|uniref:K(+)/H(+) antiporter NhaP2 n=1 Tax=Acidipropionibacterium virtanenii TaxID=2057246 RepID=A0A344UQQ4_9ACTN|nr:K(+)/H(+) antiporter NhaP2 [Acidipropionibacterium virtanenii]